MSRTAADGDTISVMLDGAAAKVRLNGIDCPESSQDFGTKAKQFTSGLAFGKDVRVAWSKKDRYGRILGTVFVGEKNVCEALVENGMAWHYVKYSDDKRLSKLEAEARKATGCGRCARVFSDTKNLSAPCPYPLRF